MVTKALPAPEDFEERYLELHRAGLRQRDMVDVFHVNIKVIKRWKQQSNLPFLRHHYYAGRATDLDARARKLGYSNLVDMVLDNYQHGRQYIAKLLGANEDSITWALRRVGVKVDYPPSKAASDARRKHIAEVNKRRNNKNHIWRKL